MWQLFDCMSARKGRQPVDVKILFKYSARLWFVPSSPLFRGVHVTHSLVFCVCFVDRCLSICTFSFGHCVVCSSSIYGFRLSLLYLQTLLTQILHVCSFYIHFLHCINLQIYKMNNVLTPLYMTSGLFLNYLLLSMTLFPLKPCNYNNNSKCQ